MVWNFFYDAVLLEWSDIIILDDEFWNMIDLHSVFSPVVLFKL